MVVFVNNIMSTEKLKLKNITRTFIYLLSDVFYCVQKLRIEERIGAIAFVEAVFFPVEIYRWIRYKKLYKINIVLSIKALCCNCGYLHMFL